MGLSLLKNKANRKSKKKFDEKYRRLTTYIEFNLYYQIQYLRENNKIDNITKFFNEAVKSYLSSMEER